MIVTDETGGDETGVEIVCRDVWYDDWSDVAGLLKIAATMVVAAVMITQNMTTHALPEPPSDPPAPSALTTPLIAEGRKTCKESSFRRSQFIQPETVLPVMACQPNGSHPKDSEKNSRKRTQRTQRKEFSQVAATVPLHY
jgi:hypothetical protein